MNAVPSWRIAMAVLAVALCLPSPGANAQQRFPARPTTVTVGFAPGGATDTFARVVAKKLSDNMGQPVIVENKPGGGGRVAWQNLLNAPADGYTLHIGGVEGFAVSAVTQADLPYRPTADFAPVTMGALSPIVYVVHADVPAASLSEFIALAKRKPGEVTYASPGIGTGNHLAGAMLAVQAGIDMLHVPYKGGGPAIMDLLGGRVSMYPAQVPTSKQHVESGKLRALAMAGGSRTPLMPAVPTVAELGYPGFDVRSSYAFFANARVSGEILDLWNREIGKVLRDPEIAAELAKQGLEPSAGTREELGRYLASEIERWRALVRDGKVKLD
jgi:tripartite-type tricarboxylate transporter receptor subunit TctC